MPSALAFVVLVSAMAQDRVEFTATVKSVALIGKGFVGAIAIPVDQHPRFTLTLQIEKVTPADSTLVSPGAQSFAIHSPARLLLTDAPVGKRFDFVLTTFDLPDQMIGGGRVTGLQRSELALRPPSPPSQ